MKRDTVKEQLMRVFNIPSFSFILEEVNRVLDDPRASAAQLSEVINRDQGLVAKILSIANSAFYGTSRRVSTVQFAIIVLGFELIRNIVAALSVMESLGKLGNQYFDQKQYWLHSVIAGSAAKKMAEDLGFPNSGEVFTTGLLHDLGIPLICKYFPDEFIQINEIVERDKIPYLDAELAVLGITHPEVASLLFDRWNLPVAIVDSVRNHHSPDKMLDKKYLAALVHVSDALTTHFSIGSQLADNDSVIDKGIISTLKLGDETYFTNFIEGYREFYTNQIDTISIHL